MLYIDFAQLGGMARGDVFEENVEGWVSKSIFG
jgi:hypothetical protein